MGRPPLGWRRMTNAEKQASYHKREKEKLRKERADNYATSESLKSSTVETNRLEYLLSNVDMDEQVRQLKAETDRLNNRIYSLLLQNVSLRDEVHKHKLTEIELRRQLTTADKTYKTNPKLSDTDRSRLVKLLGLLGSSYDGERLTVSNHIEALRQKLNKSWDDIL